MLRTYRTCNSTMGFLKYEFYNKLLGGISLLKLHQVWFELNPYIYYFKKKKLYSIHKTLTFEGFERNHDK